MHVYFHARSRAATGSRPQEVATGGGQESINGESTDMPELGSLVEVMPTEDEVRQAFRSNNWEAIGLNDVVEIGDIATKLGEEVANKFVEGLLSRRLLKETAEGSRLYVRAISFMPPPSLPQAQIVTHDVDIPGLRHEIVHIQICLTKAFTDWSAGFPEPEQGELPRDFKPAERKAMRAFVTAAIQEAELVNTEVTEESKKKKRALALELLKSDKLPVEKGRTEAALYSIIQDKLTKVDAAKRAAESKAQEIATNDNEHDNAGVGLDEDVPETEASIGDAPNTNRKRRGRVLNRHKDDEVNGKDAIGKTNRKRTRRTVNTTLLFGSRLAPAYNTSLRACHAS